MSSFDAKDFFVKKSSIFLKHSRFAGIKKAIGKDWFARCDFAKAKS